MGKNFSLSTNPDRHKSDFYQTPYNITRRLLEIENFKGSILEPANGGGAITTILKEFGYKDITAYDLVIDNIDFLEETRKFNNIITNPPYRLASKFIKKAFEVATDKIALLLPLNYLHGKKRYDEIYSLRKLEKVYVFTRYPMLGVEIRPDGKYKTGMMVYAWYIFNINYCGEPIIKWLDNNEDCLNLKGQENERD